MQVDGVAETVMMAMQQSADKRHADAAAAQWTVCTWHDSLFKKSQHLNGLRSATQVSESTRSYTATSQTVRAVESARAADCAASNQLRSNQVVHTAPSQY
jgi:hypothetical protein